MMACFVTPLAIGLVMAILSKVWRGSAKLRLSTLAYLLLGGALLLAIEHAWYGEIMPHPPFLTTMKNPEEVPMLLHEVGVVGGSMTLAVTLFWLGIVGVFYRLRTRAIGVTRITAALNK